MHCVRNTCASDSSPMTSTYVGVLLLVIPSADLRVEPAQVTLTGPRAAQQLVVVETQAGEVVADVTGAVKFATSDPQVATVDGSGVVRAVGDGKTLITASRGATRTTTAVQVEKMREPFAWNFRNHIEPVLTRLGCNSGACHGALAGKGGFKLSLRGYAPSDDYFVLTRQAGARRVNRQEPARSLLLLKPALALPHGGGQKLEPGTPDYEVLAEWIAAGAPGPTPEDLRLARLEA